MSLGWGIPILLVVGQICHNKIIGFENCFPEGSSIRYWNEIPIIVMLTINFEIFILIISKISTKLIPNGGQRHGSHSSPTCPGNATRGTGRTVPTLRLAKATLTLIPVMGMQNLLFILIPSQGVEDRTIEIRNLIEQSLEAYSGILVAIIYCYLNHEVQGEIGRYIMNTRLRWLIFEERRTGVERFRQRVSRVSQDVSVIQPKRKSRRTRSKRLSKKNSRKCSIGETRKLRDEASSTRILSSDRDDSEEVINKIDNYDFESTDYNV
ncbi:Oidioi.mRNA.OKI2018_I69.XSR.g14335.t1.cds [Oikopleura dioica]|uniref:Oidioi.mRNA.OKI2018_I69.XSR.g14335.t1.cds n=1 Tax=Oikopleura dioica TaxID=34765 RepID=A0ABN7S9K3_OIKDI|nr:Oidioi.mRNA.OKI2018_I69.XSR.g14335.t1.cds [Oikopleura dioica]